MRRVFFAGGEGNASIVEPCRNFRSGSAKRHEGAESRKCLAISLFHLVVHPSGISRAFRA
jgi:hypothetical protein